VRRRLNGAPAIGIVARDQILSRGGGVRRAGGRPQLAETRLHLLNLGVEARTTRRQRRPKDRNLRPVAAERTGGADGAIEFRALLLDGAGIAIGTGRARLVERCDLSREPRAVDRLREGRTMRERHSRKGGPKPDATALSEYGRAPRKSHE